MSNTSFTRVEITVVCEPNKGKVKGKDYMNQLIICQTINGRKEIRLNLDDSKASTWDRWQLYMKVGNILDVETMSFNGKAYIDKKGLFNYVGNINDNQEKLL